MLLQILLWIDALSNCIATYCCGNKEDCDCVKSRHFVRMMFEQTAPIMTEEDLFDNTY